MADHWPAAMTLETAAAYLECSPTTIERLLREGYLRALTLRDGGDRRIRRVELDRYLEERQAAPVRVHSA